MYYGTGYMSSNQSSTGGSTSDIYSPPYNYLRPNTLEPSSSTRSSPSEPKNYVDEMDNCDLTGVGLSANQIYRTDGFRESEHEMEDHFLHKMPGDNTYFYGLFDGFSGPTAAKYFAKKIVDKVLLGQLFQQSSDADIESVLRNAFLDVDTDYFVESGDKLAQRTAFLAEVNADYIRNDPPVYAHFESLNRQAECGASAVIVLIFNGKVYVANTGDTRALLCVTDSAGALRVTQVSSDHTIKNDKELQRLQELGLSLDYIKQRGKLGNQDLTRCLGNYLVKAGYKEDQFLNTSSAEPVIAVPSIQTFRIDDSTRFLILASSGMYKALEDTSEIDANISLVQLIIEEFKVQSSLYGVAQAVVDKVSRMHFDYFKNPGNSFRAPRREDMTLLVRNFNFPLRNHSSISSPTMDRSSRLSSFSSNVNTPTNPNFNINSELSTPSPQIVINDDSMYTRTDSTDSTETDMQELRFTNNRAVPLPLDENQKLIAYVDFSEYYSTIGKDQSIEDEIMKKIDNPSVESIPE